ncbi:MAG: tRNA (adenosine(37)-N6)-threonylcarbamoyltransferase complex dimerization subunit type 1 TsaB [Candidatus Peregrinibacteria bacterium]
MILCIDTCTPYAGIALIDKSDCHYKSLPKGQYGESVIPFIEAVLEKAKVKPKDLTGILVIRGPGSFTGLRVGIAIANQFAHQLKIPIIGLRTEEWWAHRTKESNFLYLQSMNRDEVYNGERIIPLVDMLNQIRSDHWKWMGDLSAEHRKKLPATFKEITKLNPPKKTWYTVAHYIDWQMEKNYALIEPYYGKEPTITKGKKR